MTNLLHETKDALRRVGRNYADVRWVGSKHGVYAIDWAAFVKMADFEYDSGFGSQMVATDLIVVGDDWWMERYEYDGSESWSFVTMPTKPVNPVSFPSVNVEDVGRIGWCQIEEIIEELEEQSKWARP